jgi:hypothetical protein
MRGNVSLISCTADYHLKNRKLEEDKRQGNEGEGENDCGRDAGGEAGEEKILQNVGKQITGCENGKRIRQAGEERETIVTTIHSLCECVSL